MAAIAEVGSDVLKSLGIEDSLSPMMLAFVRNLASDPNLNHTEAARKAGYSKPESQGSHLLKDPRIAKAACALIRDSLTKAKVTKERVLKELAGIAFADLGDYVNDDGTLKPLSEIPLEKRRVLSEYKTKRKSYVQEDGSTITIEDLWIKTWSKIEALTLLCKHLNLLAPDTVNNNLIINTIDWSSLGRQIEDKRRALEEKMRPTITVTPVVQEQP